MIWMGEAQLAATYAYARHNTRIVAVLDLCCELNTDLNSKSYLRAIWPLRPVRPIGGLL